MDKEKGFSVCQGGHTIALVHNHPSGNIRPSQKDLETAHIHGVKVCVSVKKADGNTQTKCYKPRKSQ